MHKKTPRPASENKKKEIMTTPYFTYSGLFRSFFLINNNINNDDKKRQQKQQPQQNTKHQFLGGANEI